MKLVSFAIPSYNSESYLNKCVDSLLPGGDDVEIIIVNDGSKDRTQEIALEYARKYPNIVKAVYQENKGHGGAVNTGLKEASGLYYKVVDSDDWFDETAYMKYLDNIRELVKKGTDPDMLVTNYVYEHVEDDSSRIMRYKRVFPENQIFTWEETKPLKVDQFLMMHAVTYKRELLLDCGLELPEHTFYVDNIYVYYPLPFVKSICYMDLDLYRYFIGRSDQSVNEKVMASRVDQQVRVTYAMLDSHDLSEIRKTNYILYKNMFSSMSMVMAVTTVFLYLAGDAEHLEKRDELWNYIKEKDSHIFSKMKYFTLNAMGNFPGYQGRKLSISIYRLAQKIYKFN